MIVLGNGNIPDSNTHIYRRPMVKQVNASDSGQNNEIIQTTTPNEQQYSSFICELRSFSKHKFKTPLIDLTVTNNNPQTSTIQDSDNSLINNQHAVINPMALNNKIRRSLQNTHHKRRIDTQNVEFRSKKRRNTVSCESPHIDIDEASDGESYNGVIFRKQKDSEIEFETSKYF